MHRKAWCVVLAVAAVVVACAPVDQKEYLKYTLLGSPSAGEHVFEQVSARPGVTLSFSGRIPSDAKAVVLWFPGAEGFGGAMELDNVLIANGIGFVTVSPPSDRPRGFYCCNSPFRDSARHLRDIGAVIGYMKSERRLPVWLMGISMGTVSIANAATNLPDAVDGVIFLSSITDFAASGFRARGESMVTDMRLSKIKVPVLAAAHAQDGDPTTPPSGAALIVRRAVNAPVKEAKIFSEGDDVAPYGGGSGNVPHTFFGRVNFRPELAEYVAAFILANTPPRTGRPAGGRG